MCPDVNSKNEERISSSSAAVADKNPSSSLLNHCVSNVLLQTLLVKIKHGVEERVIRAIVDTGSIFSYVSTKAAKVLKLKKQDEVLMAHGLFGGTETTQQKHNIYKVQVLDVNLKKGMELTVLKQRKSVAIFQEFLKASGLKF